MATFKHILVPLDGSNLAEKALPLAAALAQQFNSEIFLIRVVDFLKQTELGTHLSSTTATQMTTTHKQALKEAHDYLHQQQVALQEQGYPIETLLRETPPANAIIEAAYHHHIDCIVMSTHGRSGLMRLALGSVADQIVCGAPCPVLLVRPDQKTDASSEEPQDN